IQEVHHTRKPYDDTKLTLVLTRDVLGRDYWHIHTLEIDKGIPQSSKEKVNKDEDENRR
ncbi:unnamed protein product, partial [marine sediment metagenome]